jgi:hypothetical protein
MERMSHKEANKIIRSAAFHLGLSLSPVSLIILQAVGYRESSYGAGWKPGKGEGSHNWGAVQAGSLWKCDTFQTVDTSPETGEYVGSFRVYDSDLDGAIDMVRILTRTEAERKALEAGDIELFSRAMKAAGYYEGIGPTEESRIARHQAWLRSGAEEIALELGVEFPKKKESSVSAGSGSGNVPSVEEIAKRVVTAVFTLSGVSGKLESFETRFVKALQTVVGTIPDGKPGPKTAQACVEAIKWFR